MKEAEFAAHDHTSVSSVISRVNKINMKTYFYILLSTIGLCYRMSTHFWPCSDSFVCQVFFPQWTKMNFSAETRNIFLTAFNSKADVFIYLDFKPKYLCFNDVFCSSDSTEGCEAEMWGSKGAERLQRESSASGETAFDGVGLIPPLCSRAVQSWRVGRQRQRRGNFKRSRTRTPPDPPTPEINPPQRLRPAEDNDLQWPPPPKQDDTRL